MQAVEMENPAITQLLLHRGADVDRLGDHGYTPLHIAVDSSIDGTIQTGGHAGEEPWTLSQGRKTRAILNFASVPEASRSRPSAPRWQKP
jgi:hypothetical protein